MSMGDAGEGLVDAESRLAERMEEREQEKRKARQAAKGGDPERARQLESLRLARTEMQRQLDVTTHAARKQQLGQAIAELDRRIRAVEVGGPFGVPTTTALAYHEATKHHFNRFARSAGHLDWATQPDPFRRYAGASLCRLPRDVLAADVPV